MWERAGINVRGAVWGAARVAPLNVVYVVYVVVKIKKNVGVEKKKKNVVVEIKKNVGVEKKRRYVGVEIKKNVGVKIKKNVGVETIRYKEGRLPAGASLLVGVQIMLTW